ncbi:MAG: hypothetical protein ACI4JK_00320, partial [Oscillospiraceae bacterium]
FTKTDFGKYGTDSFLIRVINWHKNDPFGFRLWLGNPTTTRGAYGKRAILRCFTDYAVQDGYGHYQLLERVLLSKYYGHFL